MCCSLIVEVEAKKQNLLSESPCARMAARLLGRRLCVESRALMPYLVSLARLSTALPTCYRKSALPLGLVEPDEEKFVVRSPWPSVTVPEINLAEWVWELAPQHAESTALVCGLTGHSLTYLEAKNMAQKFGSALLRMGAQRGDVVCLLLPNMPEFPVLFLGAVGAGFTVSTCKTTLRPEELAVRLENCQAKWLVTAAEVLAGVRQAKSSYTNLENVILVDAEEQGCICLKAMLMDEDGSLYESQPATDVHKEVAAMSFSSGTTGPPKGVLLSHFNMVAAGVQMLAPGPGPSMDCGSQQISLAYLPFSHIYSMAVVMIAQLRLGHRLITLPHYDEHLFTRALSNFKPTVLHLVPPILAFLANNRAVKPEHLKQVKLVMGGAAHFCPTLVQGFLAKLPPGVQLLQGFAMSETSGLTHCQALGGSEGGIGSLLPNTMAKLVDWETGETVGPGNRGELCVSGPQVMLGYHRNSRATKRQLQNHWLHTGDVATYDASSNQFVIIDRLREMIKVKGVSVAPSEIEDVVRDHPGIIDAAVVGVPDEMTGERPRAYCIRRKVNVQEVEVMRWVEERLPSHMKLGTVMFVDSLPKNSTGKTLRRQLRVQVFKGSFGGF